MPAAALAVLVTACGSASPGAAHGTNSPASMAQNPASSVVVGVITDRTGPASSSGLAVQEGLNYFIHATNASGGVDGHPVKLQYCDTQSTATGGVNCAKQLSAVGSHVVLLAGALPSTEGAVPQLSDVIGLAGLPVLFPKAGTSVFQVLPTEHVQVAPLITEAKSAHVEKMGILYTSDSSGTSQLHAIQASASKAGIKVASQAMNTSATDVTTQLLQLKSSGAQVLVLASIGQATLVSLSSYHTLGMSLPVVVGAEAVTNAFLKALSFPIPSHLYGLSQIPVASQGLTSAEKSAWDTYAKGFAKYVHQPIDNETMGAFYMGCVAVNVLKTTHEGTAPTMAKYLSTKPVNCNGAPLTFNVPGLNVVSSVPVSLTQAGPSVSDGWGPMRSPL